MAKNNITNFNEHLTGRYGDRGSERRIEFGLGKAVEVSVN